MQSETELKNRRHFLKKVMCIGGVFLYSLNFLSLMYPQGVVLNPDIAEYLNFSLKTFFAFLNRSITSTSKVV